MPEREGPRRSDLCRSADFVLVRAEPDGAGDDGLTIEGYGAVFNSVTQIDSWEGTFEEVIAPGAFRKSLRELTPRMQFDHGRHPLLGSLPLGKWSITEEDARGLHVVGRLTDNWLVQPFREAIRDGGVEGMSFRFSVVRDEWTDKDGKRIKDEELFDLLYRGPGDRGPIRRTLKEVRVSEVGPVVWPAYSDTQVGVRSHDDGSRVVVLDLAGLRSGKPSEISRLARLVAVADEAARGGDAPDDAQDEPSDVDDATTGATTAQTSDDESDSTTTDSTNSSEPRTTDRSAGRHPSHWDAPPTTGQSAGEHSPAIPLSPAARRDEVSKRYRAVTERMLAISTKNPQADKEGPR